MELKSRSYLKGDYEKHIQKLTKDNMQELFIDNFGGWSDSVSEKRFFNVVDNGFIELFFLDDIFIGYVSFNSEKYNEYSFLINDIHILKQYQRQGYGVKILEFVINKVKYFNCKQLKIFVFNKNPSLNFYKRNGFILIEHLEKSNTSVMVRGLSLTSSYLRFKI